MAIKLELYLVRHGQSMTNAGLTDTLDGNLKFDPPLTEKGKKQAELLGRYCSELKLDCLFSSGLKRSLDTANIIAKYQHLDGAKKVEAWSLFTERNTGFDCKGRYIDEIQKEFPLTVCNENQPENERIIFNIEDGSDELWLSRAQTALDYLLDRFHNGEKIMLATHAAFNTFIVFAALKLGTDQIFDIDFYNTSITKIVFFEEGTGQFGDVHLIYQNAVPHLINEMPEFKY